MVANRVGVVGAGQMGNGIAQVAAMHKFSVGLMDVSEASLQQAVATIEKSCDRLIKKEVLTADEKASVMSRIETTREMTTLRGCDVVIEAASEDLSVKSRIFQQLDDILGTDAILCTNTSSIPITQLAAQTSRAERVAGMHFMNPVPVMKLVEGIRGLQTSDDTFAQVRKLAEDMGKTFIEAQDMPGFAVNRILMPMINEAITALQDGLASEEDIDTAMKLGTNQPMGPLTLADFIGLDTCLSIMEVLFDGFKDSKYRPSPLLRKYVQAGWLGRKTGRGFYSYDN